MIRRETVCSFSPIWAPSTVPKPIYFSSSETSSRWDDSTTQDPPAKANLKIDTPTPTEDSSKTISQAESDIVGSHSGGSESLNGVQFIEEILKIVNHPDVTELMILELIEKCSFSFFKVKYVDIAPKAGLNLVMRGDDLLILKCLVLDPPRLSFSKSSLILRPLRGSMDHGASI